MQATGRVNIEIAKSGHAADLRREPDEVAAVEQELADCGDGSDLGRQSLDLRPLLTGQAGQRFEFRCT